ncbi:PLP-dependent transferase [Gonapodya prolifera JEL478]|uniref:alanine--glyoxylate transaminase n=1 Tax=Gonapodya prolifera (strain JEL478) TaxID=1344416 RepID=A0A139ATY4_GONPJ|nr:PLP-dependent transferase [Gonapodya prolifera JEL478]|eukprot:KXS20043.1 PLP-dependent transferase [Gonapodya prolifera JEL478]
MIPGPVEFDSEVLAQMASPAMSHMDPVFQNIFGETIEMTREVFGTKTGQPLIIAASGTAGWDTVAANLTQPGEHAIVVSTGLFSDRFAECLEAYGAKVTTIKAKLGHRPSLTDIEAALTAGTPARLITITHTDTSAGVLWDVPAITALVRRVSPSTLVVVDGVCSVGCEELKVDEWDVDVVHTASQKALGAPPGLAVMIFSQRALDVFKARTTPVLGYYFSLKKWLPIMTSYEARKAQYFATPAVQLVTSLHTSLSQILAQTLPARLAAHRAASDRVKDALERMGLRLVPVSRDVAAHGMTAAWLPQNVELPDFLPRVSKRGVVLAGGLHPEAPTRYFRVGHMNVSVIKDAELGHIGTTLKAIEESLEDAGHVFPAGYKKV